MSKNGNYSPYKHGRHQLFNKNELDSYKKLKKYPEPTICSTCGSLYTNGGWSWGEIPEKHYEGVCPACQRIADNYPAGIIELSGEFFYQNRDEILNLIQNIERLEIKQHPLERFMNITNVDDNKTNIMTTGIHVARRVGEALKKAYKGNLDCNYDEENFIRVHWKR